MWSEFCVFLLAITGTSGFVNLVRDQGLSGAADLGPPGGTPVTSARARIAIDGNSDTCFTMNNTSPSSSIYWKVWLARSFNIAYLRIHFKSDTVGRSTGFSIYTYDTQDFYPLSDPKHLVYRHDPMSGCPSPIQNVTVNNITQGLVIINERPDGYTSTCQDDDINYPGLDLCEINVMGCDDQRYSSSCNTGCPATCANRHCDAFNGSCIHGCDDRRALTIDCIVCNDGTYIVNKQCIPCRGHCKDGASCNKLTGRCDDGCANHWTGDDGFCQVCPPYYYGMNCDSPCGQCRGDSVCNKSTGHCPNGCKEHWQGDKCDECEDGFYSATCTAKCGHCLHNVSCLKKTGYCPQGCEPNYMFPLCQECADYFYDETCSSHCGQCHNGEPCDKRNGVCQNGCLPNYNGSKCDVCKDGFYNENCSEECGRCLNSIPCNKQTGICPLGCRNHFQRPLCQECEDKFYGPDCNKGCGQCKNDEICDKKTGNCLQGCKSNFQPPLCQECKNGYYGSNCNNTCGHCINDEFCDKNTGRCINGCKPRFQNPFCQVCENGFYNRSCTATCGKCLGGEPCDKQTGMCKDCLNHFKLPFCQECTDGYYNKICSEKCGRCVDNGFCDKTTGNCSRGCQPNFLAPLCKECTVKYYGDECNKKCDNCNETAPNCRRDDGSCLYGRKDPLQQSEDKTGQIVGGVVAALVVVAVIGLLCFVFRRRLGGKDNEHTGPFQFFPIQRRKESKGTKYAVETPTEISIEEPTNDDVSKDDGGYYNIAELTTYINKDELPRVISEKNAGENSVFLVEYKRLPAGNTDKCKAGQQQENTVKNRFKTTFPYDHSRIILKEKWTDNDNDYYNANYIKNCNGDRTYIAAQGPKNVTLTDFWRMMWQENIKLIVMLTNIVENGKNKCTQYWPEKSRVMDVGPCKIKLLEEIVYAFYTYRKFSVQNNSIKRTITQFHYTAWPDHGTPEELELVQFHRTVTKKHQIGGLMLVHCSAGVGRTGTFIGLDALLKQGRESGRINVFEFVKEMREDRMTMVQTADQYIFLHKALLCGFQEKDTVIGESNIPVIFNSLLQDTSPLNQRSLYKEHKLLQTLKPVYTDKDKEDGKRPENSEKNKDPEIFAVSKYRPYLTSYLKGRNDYINAVYVPSFTEPNGFILTQNPLKSTEVDLWRLCMDHDAHALIVLGDDTEKVSWIPQKGSTSCCTPYYLTSGDTGSSISGVSENSLMISIEEQKKQLDVYHIPFGNDNAILKGVELLLEKEKQHSFTSIILSKDGAEAAGIFCVLHNVLQQLRMDKEVDIFTAVRQVQTRRPEVIRKLDEYRRCYELVLLSISEDGIYANM